MNHKPQHGREAVEVDAHAVIFTAHDLWRHVLDCPSSPRHSVLPSLLVLADFTQAEVSDFDAPAVSEQDVVWLEITVNDWRLALMQEG